MIKKFLAAVVMTISSAAAFAVPFGSQSVLVVEDDTGKVLFEKNASTVAPIASLTKLMTAMVVLDAHQDMNEPIEIEKQDVDMLKHSTSRVPVGATIPRRDVLQLALMSSDNRAAAALARTYPGGIDAFRAAVKRKIAALGMTQTVIEEPTGLSPSNRSTAADLVKMATAASNYAEITRITTSSKDLINIKGRDVEYHNTNRLVGAKGWDIGLSKTGYTQEAGRCLIMRVKAAGKNATMVLLNAGASSVRILDALNIRRHVLGDAGPVATRAVATAAGSPRVRASARGPRIRASAGGPRIRASAGGTTRRSHKHVTVTRHRRHR
ncbi:serine hydrolase [Massilia orientalis]|uniref:Serine hydrolase n=1 Tax=Massilia orientalis TaxID=3050128 RepID=A0ACC7MAJ6_9BURK|nr:serine hydrolase [Massilia sp. YIM B02787]